MNASTSLSFCETTFSPGQSVAVGASKPFIERRTFILGTAAMTDLPFVADTKSGPKTVRRSFWSVQETDDYSHANDVGVQHACDFIQFMKQNPRFVGSSVLSNIANDMAEHKCGTAMHGYAVGFWSIIELFLYKAANHLDHYAIAEAEAQRYFKAKSAQSH